MAHPSESDYERQFQEDLEKATALSMETLALDQFRRNKIQYSHSDVSSSSNTSIFKSTSHNYLSQQQLQQQQQYQPTRPRPGSINTPSISSLQNSASTGSIAPPPTIPPRRHSETRELKSNQDEPDLISFVSPTGATNQSNLPPPESDPHSNFLKMVSNMHQMNTKLQQMPTYGFKPQMMPPRFNSPAGLQLVPYQQQQQQLQPHPIAAPTNVPLTADQLDKLYKMNYALQPHHTNMVGLNAPRQMYGQPPPMPLIIGNQSVFRSASVFAMPSPGPYHSPLAQPLSQPIGFNTMPHVTDVPKLPPRQSINRDVAQPVAKPKLTHSESFVVRRSKNSLGGGDLIDLGHTAEDNSRVSVLEAFDPLLMGNEHSSDDEHEKGDNGSDCATSYYSEYDPFDYLYSTGTQYSDPVYEAVNKIDRSPLSPGAPSIGWNIPPYASSSGAGITQIAHHPPPPLPPRNTFQYDDHYAQEHQQQNQMLDRRKMPTKLYENVVIRKTYDPELVAFYNMVKQLRAQYKHDDKITNVGHVVAAEFSNLYPEETSIKLLVHPSLECMVGVTNGDGHNRNSGGGDITVNAVEKGQFEGYGPPVVFTCDICTTVEHVIMHVFCELEGQVNGTVNDYILKPIGVTEWLSERSKLSQLECVHNSLKLERDVQLGLCPKNATNMNAISRTLQDDLRDADLKLEDILAHEPVVDTINYDNLMILLETLEDEIAKLESAVADSNPHSVFSCSGVVQAVKMICALLGSLDTMEITVAVNELKTICANGQTKYSYRDSGGSSTSYMGSQLNIVSESGDYAEVTLRPKTTAEQITHRCNHLRDSVQQLLETYSHAFRVDFCVNTPEYISKPISISNVSEPVMVHLMCLHRPPPNWRHDDYMLGAQIYHGTRYIGDAVVTQCSNEISGIFPRLKFESWLNFENIPICTLPRESRLIFVLYGCTTEPTENDANNSTTTSNTTTTTTTTTANQSESNNQVRKVTKVELGWCSIQFFDYHRNMAQGSYLLSLWPPTTDKFLGPAPAKGTHPRGYHCPVLSIEIPNYGGQVVFPEPIKKPPPARRLDFNSLDLNLQQELIDTAAQGYPNAVDKREVLWEKRYYLQSLSHALPKVLHAAHSWDFASLVDLHALIRSWQPLTPLQSLELFLPRYPDMEVRAQAVRWISAMPNDQLVDFLPQLLQALKHDTYEASPMTTFLLGRALESPRIAHHLYWLLVHSLPGDSPQNSPEQMTNDLDETLITQARYNRRNQLMLRALLAICGEKLSARFLAQNMMCKSLAECALSVQQCKESMRQKVLVQGLENVHQILLERATALPLGPGHEVMGVSSRSSSFFNSNTLPLKINFIGSDRLMLPAIFKAGDDLQKDLLTIQLVRIMDKLWLTEGLDLKMVTFNCVPTGSKKGMIEMISDAETLRKIQVEWGLTGSFKDKPIAEWLARQNPSQLEYQRAVDNFTVSCAGYSVATYILGICDRHNDNIMLKTSGHLFHIDFGKFLGDAQMFGNFKRDRTPFVLTSDMAYVINCGDRTSTKFHRFVDLCCQAFNIVRKHGDLILHMLALMATSGIPGVTADAVNYVRNALLPGQSNPEAAASFAKMIHISLKSWFTQFNFFLHNLAQMRFSGDDGNGELLSFVPRTYTMAQDGRLKSVTVHGFQKRYDLEKYYTFILKVTRQNQPDPAYLFRSYKEFSEFHQKLCLHYPLAKLHSLPSGIHVGRSNIKTVAERRLPEIRHFLISLFNSADEIAHSDLVYTFFHPLLRDQQEQDIHVAKVKETKPTNPTERVCGEIKLSLQYHRGALTVMIHHARSLPATTGGQEPNTYVKTYLKPDPTKVTKRKTKVIRKNCFPSFMETLEYRMPLEYIQNRILQVTVWSHDSLQENEFLGGVELNLVELDLTVELIKWFPLGYLSRS